jgi:hypothetical protein
MIHLDQGGDGVGSSPPKTLLQNTARGDKRLWGEKVSKFAIARVSSISRAFHPSEPNVSATTGGRLDATNQQPPQ